MYLKEIFELPSSLDWCEYNNIHSEYISEFFNTLTGFSLCITSVIVFYENNKSGHTRLFFTNYLLFLVGIGTILFHGTLLYIFQLLDELPMLLIAIDYYNILIKLEIFKKCFTRQFYDINTNINSICNLSKLNYYHISIVIIASYFIKQSLQILFFQGILTLVIAILFFIMYFINNLSNNLIIIYTQYFSLKYKLRYFNRICICIFVFSLLIWNIDNIYCSKIQFLQLHAWWHITTSIGMYYLNNIIKIIIELDRLDRTNLIKLC